MIGVESTFGNGSTFWFSLPVDATIALNFSRPKKTKDFEKSRVLIVDEDDIAADVISRKLAREIQFTLGGNAPKIILMTPFETQLKAAIAKSSDFDGFVSKPLKQSLLFDCIAKVLSTPRLLLAAITEATIPKSALRAESRAIHSSSPLHILVADDVSTNQIIAIKMLENLGHTAHAVGNGLEAIDALTHRHYDIILMDCQMPELDGFEATRAIRALPDSAKASVTVIALTAKCDEWRPRAMPCGRDERLSIQAN